MLKLNSIFEDSQRQLRAALKLEEELQQHRNMIKATMREAFDNI
jgi:hypothetical protein